MVNPLGREDKMAHFGTGDGIPELIAVWVPVHGSPATSATGEVKRIRHVILVVQIGRPNEGHGRAPQLFNIGHSKLEDRHLTVDNLRIERIMVVVNRTDVS